MRWSVKRAEDDIAVLRERREKLEREIASIDKEMEQIQIYISMASRYEAAGHRAVSATNPLQRKPKALSEPEPQENNSGKTTDDSQIVDGRFSDKSFPAAVALMLGTKRRPMTCPEITKALISAGLPFVAKKPEQSIFGALKALEKDGRVERVARGLWYLTQGDRGPSQSGPLGNSNATIDDHAQNTRAGLAAAKARGVKLGARELLTAEQESIARRMITEGKTLGVVAEAVQMSRSGFVKWMTRHGIRRTEQKSEDQPELISANA